MEVGAPLTEVGLSGSEVVDGADVVEICQRRRRKRSRKRRRRWRRRKNSRLNITVPNFPIVVFVSNV